MHKKSVIRITVMGLMAVAILGGVFFTGARFAFAGSTGTIPAYQLIHLRTSAAVSNGIESVVAQQPLATNPGGVQLNAMIFVPANSHNQGTLTCALSFDATNPKSVLESRTFTLDPLGNEFTMSTNRNYAVTGNSFVAYVQCFTSQRFGLAPLQIQVDLDLTVVAGASAFNSGIN